MTTRFIVMDAISFYVRVEGPSEGPLVILSHALMANHHMWDETVPDLHKAGFSTLRYDHIGHGQTLFPTSQVTDAYHFDDFVRHIYAILEMTGPKEVHAIIGCSMGGVLALRFAMLYPSLVRKVISCDAPGGVKALESAKPLWQDRVAKFRAEGVGQLAQATVNRWFPGECSDDIKAAALAQTQSCSVYGYEACAYAIQRYDYERDLEKVEAETMVLVGSEDTAIGPLEGVRSVTRKIADSKWVIMEGAGHLPPMHQAEKFNQIMLAFLNRS